MRKSGKIRSVAENFSPMMLTPQVGASYTDRKEKLKIINNHEVLW